MKVRNELQTVVLERSDRRTLEGVARVRMIDARVAGRGIVAQQREPVAVVVRDAAGVRRATLREREAMPAAALFLAAPLIYMVIRRMVQNGGKR